MKTIFKYRIEITEIQYISMPEDAKILTVQMQFGRPCIWALVDTDNNESTRTIEIIGTGNPISDELKEYIGTFQTFDGGLIFHVFEQLKKEIQ